MRRYSQLNVDEKRSRRMMLLASHKIREDDFPGYNYEAYMRTRSNGTAKEPLIPLRITVRTHDESMDVQSKQLRSFSRKGLQSSNILFQQ